MTSEVSSSERGLSPRQRVILAVVGSCLLGLLVVAHSLEPDARRFGTHEQLGLTPCWFQQWSGKVCPTCGMTTAWSHWLHGEFAQAAAANLGGLLLCLVAMVVCPWLLASSATGRWLAGRPSPTWWLGAATIWMMVTLLDWARRWWLD